MFKLVFAIFLALLSNPAAAFAQGLEFISIDSQPIVICPASVFESEPPEFTAENCQTVSASTINSHRRFIWIGAKEKHVRFLGQQLLLPINWRPIFRISVSGRNYAPAAMPL
ncbi:hypothetical protein [Parasphingorhabdus litoris]|uniref:hypothetical protein n=1 Tax=Parasphingorhabdus litoris TaxID=394733 RepID=UPI001E4A98C7|nr:hypothetical protein [Parasphingorhabdus litoris]